MAGGTLSGGRGLACIVSMRFPHVGGGEGIILKSMSDFDLDGLTSFTCGTTGSTGGWGREERDGTAEEEEGLVVAVVPAPPQAGGREEPAAARVVAEEEEGTVDEGGRD